MASIAKIGNSSLILLYTAMIVNPTPIHIGKANIGLRELYTLAIFLTKVLMDLIIFLHHFLCNILSKAR